MKKDVFGIYFEDMQMVSMVCWYNIEKMAAILSKYTVLCHILILLFILFGNRVVYYYTKIFLINVMIENRFVFVIRN